MIRNTIYTSRLPAVATETLQKVFGARASKPRIKSRLSIKKDVQMRRNIHLSQEKNLHTNFQ